MRISHGLGFFLFLFLFCSFSIAQTVAVDDFYVIDRWQFVNAYENDINFGGYLVADSLPEHAGLYIGNGFGCNYCTAINPYGNYTGFDSFSY